MALSVGFFAKVLQNPDTAPKQPMLQVLEVKEYKGRYRVVLSDGQHSMSGMMAGQLNKLVEEGAVVPCSVVQLLQFTHNSPNGVPIVIVLNARVVRLEHGVIGNPQPVQSASTAAMASSTATSSTAAAAPSSGATMRAADTTPCIPLKSLNPYNNNWHIRARVTHKSEIKTWNKGPNNQGSLFSVTLLDEEGTEMRATFFREAVDRFHAMIELGKVYVFSNGRAKTASTFSRREVNAEYELTFDKRSEVVAVADDARITMPALNFVPLDRLAAVATGTLVDVLAVVTSMGEMQELVSKAGRQLIKRDVQLVDSTNTSVTLTLWGEMAREPKIPDDAPVVAFSKLRTSDFGGVTLNSMNSSTVYVRPDMALAHELAGWYQQQQAAGGVAATSLSSRRGGPPLGQTPVASRHTVSAFHDGTMGQTDQTDWARLKGCITFVRSSNWCYPSCPGRREDGKDCRKKLTQLTESSWSCERCGREYERPTYRYIASMCVGDHTGQAWVTAFDEEASALLGQSADELMALKERSAPVEGSDLPPAVQAVFDRVLFQEFFLKTRARMEDTPDGERRLRVSLAAAEPVNYATENKLLIDAIQQYMGERAGGRSGRGVVRDGGG
eukprot:CAMPEP_0196780976 /NCGR_PEP_ID=MMETSP1104-20130614/8952_1 /TAXON_ID=33652 /ORGANISM="Cafeteria sp., Strain Caron Lab Isolate" /LENGTH=612 /DNA_ID=CAMNT_0042151193 /DNA_START=21 /DNA_END=1856 /DNA_ORIENTATION=+